MKDIIKFEPTDEGQEAAMKQADRILGFNEEEKDE